MSRAISSGISAIIIIILFWCTEGISADKNSSTPIPDSGLALLIKQKIVRLSPYARRSVRDEQVYSAFLVASFYRGRDYAPAWSSNGTLMQVDILMRAIDESYGEGLSPAYYHRARINSLVADVGRGQSPNPDVLADLDMLLTDAFITLGCHLSAGCVNPLTVASEWFAKGGKVDVASLLDQALKKRRIRETLMQLRPEKDIYTRLRHALAKYRGMAVMGEWPQLPAGPSLNKGAMSARVVELKKRLAASGDLKINETAPTNLFDDSLEQSVIYFQKRHGLSADGVVGRETRDALNVPLKQRIRQIELNLERLRWILGNIEERFIIVNIADFRLIVIENDTPVLSMKVVVGKPYLSTPIFTSKMTHIVINPSWNIPKSIVQKEILAKIARNPHYLAEQQIEVLQADGSRERMMNPLSQDWSRGHISQHRFRQKPGPLNALGQLKFVFPNSFDVYLHDTPAKGLFSENIRAFSHGCIRIEKPIDLAEYLLRDDPLWTRAAVVAAIDKGTEQVVPIPRPLNVHLLYLTAWVDGEGVLQFRNDVYGRDKSLEKALLKKPYIP
ncbi:MAG TPA: L,D-transpeptidase family protein [Dissulfurispiraceae bacterium]|nr:L,D-transpeptidase family protein [Dissulfurispiraceae bacterium]